jgi:hypothetical protein
MTDISRAREALVHRVLEGEGTASREQRRAAFENAWLEEPLRTLIEKVAARATAVTDLDVVAARASGRTEDQIFEIVVCAALGQSTRQYESARAALDAAIGSE